eukprot:g81012.t1
MSPRAYGSCTDDQYRSGSEVDFKSLEVRQTAGVSDADADRDRSGRINASLTRTKRPRFNQVQVQPAGSTSRPGGSGTSLQAPQTGCLLGLGVQRRLLLGLMWQQRQLHQGGVLRLQPVSSSLSVQRQLHQVGVQCDCSWHQVVSVFHRSASYIR